MTTRYEKSEAFLKRANDVIPLGSQTFSKSRTQFPLGVSPYFAEKAKGSRIWDIDGNEYIDFALALGAINLGYNDPDVTNEVREQLDSGTIFSLSHRLEAEVAELMRDMIPCAEKVRYGKNGSDATAGAIRLARAYTKREHVLVCGYHGWQDWYIGTTARNLGVPESVRGLSHTFVFNDLDSLEKRFKEFPDQVAAVILEPMNVADPAPGFLEGVKSLAHKNGALFILDETITGFRFHNGGAQALFGVTPDLATFGKGIANGYPVSAIAGRSDVMKLMEEIFFSFTFGGETLSLAAAKATLTKLKKEPVVETMLARGRQLKDGIASVIERQNASHLIGVSGHPTWAFLNFKDAGDYTAWQTKTLFFQEVFARGILTLGPHMVSYAHSVADIDEMLKVYDEVFATLKIAVEDRKLPELLKCDPLVPLFKVRG